MLDGLRFESHQGLEVLLLSITFRPALGPLGHLVSRYWGSFLGVKWPVNTLATGYGDFRTSVAKRRRRDTEISVFRYRWMEEGFGFVMC